MTPALPLALALDDPLVIGIGLSAVLGLVLVVLRVLGVTGDESASDPAPAPAGPSGEEEEVDIVKFFIGVMSLLTLVVAGFSGLYYARAGEARDRAGAEVSRLRSMMATATDPNFRDRVREALENESSARGQGSLYEFLLAKAREFQVRDNLPQIDSDFVRRRDFDKRFSRMEFQGARLENVVRFLFQIQAEWPGLKIETLRVRPERTREEDARPTWEVFCEVAVYSEPPSSQ